MADLLFAVKYAMKTIKLSFPPDWRRDLLLLTVLFGLLFGFALGSRSL